MPAAMCKCPPSLPSTPSSQLLLSGERPALTAQPQLAQRRGGCGSDRTPLPHPSLELRPTATHGTIAHVLCHTPGSPAAMLVSTAAVHAGVYLSLVCLAAAWHLSAPCLKSAQGLIDAGLQTRKGMPCCQAMPALTQPGALQARCNAWTTAVIQTVQMISTAHPPFDDQLGLPGPRGEGKCMQVQAGERSSMCTVRWQGWSPATPSTPR